MVISTTVLVCSVGFPAKGLLPSAFPGMLCAAAEVQPLHVLPATQSAAASTAGWRRRSVKLWAEFYTADSRSAAKRCYCSHQESQAQLWLVPEASPLQRYFPSKRKGGALCFCPSHSLQSPVICFSFTICVTEIKRFAYHCRALGDGWVESTLRASPHLAPAVTSRLPEGA